MITITKEKLLLLLIVFIGTLLRFYNLNWDEGLSFHPDERNIAASVSRISFTDSLNPEFFAYGSLPIYLYRAAGDVLLNLDDSKDWNYNWGHINLVGRFFSALFSSLTIPVIYFVGKKFFNKEVALISSAIFAFCVGAIQTAHFAVTESILMLSISLITLFSLWILRHPGKKINYLFLGVVFGLGVASKLAALSFLIIPLTAVAITIKDHRTKPIKLLTSLFVFFATSLFIFLLTNPYTVLNYEKFLESMRYESSVVSGSLQVVYTFQFNNTLPYLFQIENLLWQMGIVAGFSIVGILVILIDGIKTKNKSYFLFSVFPILYFLYVGSWHTKFIRYLDPLLPFLSISSAFFLYTLMRHFKGLGRVTLLTVVVLTALWAFAFSSIYTREQTRIEASRWIYQNIESGSILFGEHWDDGLPVALGNKNPDRYKVEQLSIYDEDNENKIVYFSEKLAKGDYVIINSRRLYGTLLNLPHKYPVTSRYYNLLFEGKLGYKKIAEFSSYPNLLGMEIIDDKSEETFQVYDHPKVLIFENSEKLDKNILYKKLADE